MMTLCCASSEFIRHRASPSVAQKKDGAELGQETFGKTKGPDWPTVALIVACYGIWLIGTTWAAALWLPLGVALVALALVLHSSLTHEVLHGHPFRSRAVNEALMFPAIGLCFPYGRFRDTHLAHHQDERLTDPYDDPESNFFDPAVWVRLGPLAQALLRANNTLAGRMVLGPAIGVCSFVATDFRAIRTGDRAVLRDWLLHAAGLVPVIWWLSMAAMPVWSYGLAVYLSMSVLKIRTYLEHRAHEVARGRTVVVERGGILGFLFLYNNLHAVHHAKPNQPWYRLPAMWRQGKADWLRRNEGYFYPSYAAIFRRHFIRAKDPVPHPLWTGRIGWARGGQVASETAKGGNRP